ncbi:MAG: hypothetical protein K9L57_06020 [Spirochaetaceae bacterium]|nr:hypothetical protein [Spirochaetaceae bacterium]
MNKEKLLKIGGVVAIIGGTAALFMSGTSESTAVELVAGVFVVAGVVAMIIKDKLSK